MKRFLSILTLLGLLASPANAANQASVQTPTSGPMSAATFTSTYLNPALLALFTCNWGPSAPANGVGAVANFAQCWMDSTNSPNISLKYYDGTQFAELARLNTSTHLWSIFATSTVGNWTVNGNLAVTGTATSAAHTITSNLANALAAGPNGTTNPSLNVDASTASAVTGLNIKSAASGGGVALSVISSNANEPFSIDAKGGGAVNIGANSGSAINLDRATFLGVQGSIAGALSFANLTSGLVTINPPTGALGAATWTLQIGNDTFVGRATTDTLTGKTINGASNTLVVRIANDVTGLGTSVATALGVNVGSAGAFVVNGGALGSPSSVGTMPGHTINGQTIFSIASTVASATAATLDDLNIQAATTTITGNTGSPITRLAKTGLYRPTITDASAVTVTDAATLYIDNSPLAAGSVTITNPWAMLVGAGATKLQATTINAALTYGGVTLSNAVTGTGNMALSANPVFTGTLNAGTINATGSIATSHTVVAIGPAGTGVSSPEIFMDAGSGAGAGGIFVFRKNSVTKIFFGQSSGITGSGTSDDFLIQMNGGFGNAFNLNYAAGDASFFSTTASTTTATGSGIFSGGVGVAKAIYAGQEVVTGVTTFAALPACNAGRKGARHFITDELAAVAFNTAATGGGANNVPLFCDGAAWRIGSLNFNMGSKYAANDNLLNRPTQRAA